MFEIFQGARVLGPGEGRGWGSPCCQTPMSAAPKAAYTAKRSVVSLTNFQKASGSGDLAAETQFNPQAMPQPLFQGWRRDTGVSAAGERARR